MGIKFKGGSVCGAESYTQMSAEEKAQVKATHKAIRAKTSERYGNLAWGFVRGFPYRRIERTTRTQVGSDGKLVEHNKPDARYLTHLLGEAIPGSAELGKSWWNTKAHPEIEAWLANPDGAIPAPVREKKPFTREVA